MLFRFKVLGILLLALSLSAQAFAAGSRIRDLPLDAMTPPASADMIPKDNAASVTTTRTTIGAIRSGLASSASVWTCTPPLLCNGAGTMDLSGARTLALLGTGTLTPAATNAPLGWKSTGSTATDATNEGARTAMMHLFDTVTSNEDSVALMLDCIQRTHVGTIRRTCMHVKIYSEPDNGGDVSGVLIGSSGGGPGLTVYKHAGLRPATYTDQSLSIQPALEVGSGDAGPAITAGAGSSQWGTPKRNRAIEAVLGAAAGSNQSDGILVRPLDTVFDSRIAFAVGLGVVNAAPTSLTARLDLNGDFTLTHQANVWTVVTAGVKLTNGTNDGSTGSFTFLKSRSGGSVLTSENIGDLDWNFVNSVSTEKAVGIFRMVADDKTSGSEDASFHWYTIAAGGALTDRMSLSSVGALAVTGVVTGSNLSGTNTGDQTISLTGDVTGSGTGAFVATIANDAVTLAKMANITTSSLLGRTTASTGDPEVLSVATTKTLLAYIFGDIGGALACSQLPALTGDVTTSSCAATIAAGAVSLAKMASMATASFLGRNTAGTGAPEVLSTATVKTLLNLTGTNSGDQTITLTGDVTGSGTGSFATTIAAGTVSLSKMANMATASFLGRNTAGTGFPEVLSVATAQSMLGVTVSGFTDSGTTIATTTTTDLVGLGGTPATKLHLLGAGTTSSFYADGDAAGATLYLQDSGGSVGNGGQIVFGASQGAYAGIKGGITNGTGPAGWLAFQTRTTSGNVIERLHLDEVGNLGLGLTAFGGSAQKVLALASGTAPTTSPADAAQLWVADAAAGDANLFARNEAGIAEQLTGLRKRVKTQFDKTSSAALSTVTDLTYNVEAKSYGFSAVLFTTSNVAGGIQVAIGGTATATSVIYEGESISTGSLAQTRATALGTAVCALTATTTARCDIVGTITVSAGGTLVVQFAQNVSNVAASSVLVGSRFYLEPIGN